MIGNGRHTAGDDFPYSLASKILTGKFSKDELNEFVHQSKMIHAKLCDVQAENRGLKRDVLNLKSENQFLISQVGG